jgi:hypothetical protein
MTLSWAVGRINMGDTPSPGRPQHVEQRAGPQSNPAQTFGLGKRVRAASRERSPTRHATAAAQAQRTDARSTIRTVAKDRVRQVKAEATVGSDAELAPRHLRCGNRRSAEQHRTDRRGHPAEQRADQSGAADSDSDPGDCTACAP